MRVDVLEPAVAMSELPGDVVLRLSEDPAAMLDVLGVPLANVVASGPDLVVLDLTGVARVTRLGIGVMLAVRRSVVGYGGVVRVRGVEGDVWELFRRTGLDMLFTRE